jgi:hypothetical protein
MRWEYRLYSTRLDRDDEYIREALNDLGQDQWELVTVYEKPDARIFSTYRQHRADCRHVRGAGPVLSHFLQPHVRNCPSVADARRSELLPLDQRAENNVCIDA